VGILDFHHPAHR